MVAIIRPIAGESIPGTGGFMSEQVRPVKNSFTGDPMRKIIRAGGIAMDYGCASITSENSSHYHSWYA